MTVTTFKPRSTRKPSANPPKTLSAEAKKWWRRFAEEYEITDEAGLFLLQAGLEAFDRMREAQKQLDTDGLTTKDRFGQVRAHPAVQIERDSRAAMVSAIKALNLDIEPLRNGPGRPGGS